MPSKCIRIGTSGVVLPGNKSTFPQEFRNASRLHYYSSLFNSLEINSSFYKIPLAATFTKWANDSMGDFKFTVKLWRGVTHAKHLSYSNDDIINFMQAANQLQSKSGCLLLQFPASISAEYIEDVKNILFSVQQLNVNSQWTPAVEFRHKSWYQGSTYQMLDQFNSALVIHDMPNSRTPTNYEPNQLVYLRFHGPTGLYNGSYGEDFISLQAERIMQWKQQGKEVYVYFNNTIGDALNNALALQKLVSNG